PNIENRRDQQNRIGAQRSGFDNMNLVDREVLTQNRNGYGCPRTFEVGQFPLEKFLIGEDAQRRSATRRVQSGDRSRIEVRCEYALARRSLLYFGDNRRKCGGDGSSEVSGRSTVRRPAFQLGPIARLCA